VLSQTEACCIPSEVEPSGMICRQLDPLCCDDLGGTTQGPGTACQFGTEACCIPSDTDPLSITCTDVDPLCCDELGGTPQGPGTACVDMTIACCLTDGTCTDVDPVCCDDLGGVPSPYGEPHCLGDTNDNGIDDACEDTWYWKDYNGDLPDGYMPDYDQNQDFNGDGAVDLNYCGPTAVANSIWWFHRKFPDEGVVPNSWTVLDLVQNLAWRMATNGQSPSPNGHVAPYAGTFWDDMQSGIDAYLQAQGADDLLYEHTEPQPTFDYIADEVERSQDVVLLVGFYHIEWVEQTGEDMWTVHWVRRGGHYLTVAGVDRVKKRLALSDTDADAAEHGSSGVVRPAGVDHNHDGDNDPTTALPFRDPGYDHSVHNSETYASHDFHGVRPSFSPGGVMALTLEGDPLAYGTRMQNYHWGDAGGTYDAGTTTVTLVFLQEHGYPIPEYCQTYTEVEYAVVVSPFDTCEPTSDGQGCEPATCPVATEQCLPKKVNYDPTNGMVIVTECECIDPSYCHVNWDLQPFCMGGCPLNEECVSVETPLPNGTVDFECQCVPPPPPEAKWSQLPHPEGEGFDAASDLWWPQIFKVIQPPDPNWSGLHSHDWADASGEYYWTRIADDWLCEGGVVTDLHWWGNYENNDRRSGIDHFHLSIHICASWPPGPWCVPGEPPMWETDVPMTMITETDTGLVNNMGETIYLYKFDLPDPFPQLTGTYYWLDVQAVAVDPLAAPIWRWQEARRDVAPPLQHAPAASRTESTIWQSVIWPAIPPETPERYSDMAFAVTSVVEPAQQVNKVVADDFKSDGRRIEGLRWWGSYFDERYAPGPTIDPTHVLDGWLISFHYDEPDRVCPPDVSATITPNVLGVYFAPPEAVTIVSLGVSDCFGHGIYEYVVNLRQCCLICSAPDPRIPNGTYPAQPEAFFETHGFIYWLDIQAVTGAKWVPTAVEPGCELRLTGHLPSDLTSDGHFWGWHTSPDHWREEACTGRIVDFSPYPPNCWIYGDWVKQPWLCGTMPPFPPVDMAFELLTPEKRGDCTGDGVVDLADYLVFESCLAGPNAGLGAGCECADLDVDMDVDLVDFAIFQIVFEG